MSKLSKWLKKAEQAISNAIPHQHSADKRAANQAVQEQIEYYKTAKETLTKETDRVEAERNRTNAKIDKKKIKSARHAYRAPGFMEDATSGYSDTLG